MKINKTLLFCANPMQMKKGFKLTKSETLIANVILMAEISNNIMSDSEVLLDNTNLLLKPTPVL